MRAFKVLFYKFCNLIFIAVKYTIRAPDDRTGIGGNHSCFDAKQHRFVGSVVGYISKYNGIYIIFLPEGYKGAYIDRSLVPHFMFGEECRFISGWYNNLKTTCFS